MIQHFKKTTVLSNTLNTDKLENQSISLDREVEISILVAQLEKECERSGSLAREIKKLREQVALLTSHNQTLQNCWASAMENHNHAEARTRVWISRAASKDAEIEAASLRLEESTAKCLELRRRVVELEEHLNPTEEGVSG